MDQLNSFYQIIYPILKEYADLPYYYGDLKHQLIVGEDRTQFNDKIWVHRDGLEDGIANDLVAAGIPKSQIVLGFHAEDVRPYTEFAVN